MTIEELMRKIDFHPEKDREYTEKVEYSSKLQGWEFERYRRTFFGYSNCTTNVLAEKDDSVMMAMCKKRK